MKKYNTRPIDYTGCHPVIAEALKRGEVIECFVHDSPARGHMRYWVFAYLEGTTYPYKTAEEAFRYAEPIHCKVKRILPRERAIPTLIADGWKLDDNGDLVGYGNSVLAAMFKLMGKPLSDPKVSVWAWPPCIIEEVEDDG